MKMIEHNHFICHLILGTFTEYPFLNKKTDTLSWLNGKSIRFFVKSLQNKGYSTIFVSVFTIFCPSFRLFSSCFTSPTPLAYHSVI